MFPIRKWEQTMVESTYDETKKKNVNKLYFLRLLFVFLLSYNLWRSASGGFDLTVLGQPTFFFFFFVSSFIACDLHRSWQWGQPTLFFVSSFLHSTYIDRGNKLQKNPFPHHYGSSSGHRQAVASSAPLVPVRTSDKKL